MAGVAGVAGVVGVSSSVSPFMQFSNEPFTPLYAAGQSRNELELMLSSNPALVSGNMPGFGASNFGEGWGAVTKAVHWLPMLPSGPFDTVRLRCRVPCLGMWGYRNL